MPDSKSCIKRIRPIIMNLVTNVSRRKRVVKRWLSSNNASFKVFKYFPLADQDEADT